MEQLITVIVTAYNLEKYIVRALDSICNQLYSNLEVLIVEDGSTDNTPSICDEYALKDSRVKVIHKPNGGLAAARKTGVENATGDYIGFVDGDDTIEPDMYQHLYNNLLNYQADISHCSYRMIFDNGEIKELNGTGIVVLQNHDKGIIDLLQGKYIEPGVCNKLYKRELFEKVNYVTDLMINEDLMLNSMLFSAAKVSIYEDVCKYNYYQNEGSMSKVFTEKHFIEPVRVRLNICNNYEKESDAVKDVAKNCLLGQYVLNCYTIKEENLKEYQNVYKENKTALKKLWKTVNVHSKNTKIKAWIVLYAPFLCKPVRGIFRMIYGRGKYE